MLTPPLLVDKRFGPVRLTIASRPPVTNGHGEEPAAELTAIVWPKDHVEFVTSGGRTVTLTTDDMQNFLAAIIMANESQ